MIARAVVATESGAHPARDTAYRPEPVRPTRAAGATAQAGSLNTDRLEAHLDHLGAGGPLPSSVRDWAEARLGHEFAGVRIHTGPTADAAARSIDAAAFTVGSDVVFRDGRFDPASAEGRHLLAHELVHTIQQGTGISRWVARRPEAADASGQPAVPLDERIRRIKELVQNVWTGPGDEAEILRLLESTPAGQAQELVRRVDSEQIDGKLLRQALDDSIDGDNNLRLHEVMSNLRIAAQGAESVLGGLANAPVLPWHDVMGFFEDNAVFFVRPGPEGKVRIKYPVRVLASTQFGGEVDALDPKHFIGGYDYDPNQLVKIHDYDNDRFVNVLAGELLGYQHLGVRNFLNRTATIATLATPLGAARTAAGRAALIAMERVLPAVTLLVEENRRNLVRWFPNWGPRIIRVIDDIQWIAAAFGLGQLLRSGWRLVGELRELRAVRRTLDAAQTEEQALRVASQVEQRADDLIEQAEQAKRAEDAAGGAARAEGAGGPGGATPDQAPRSRPPAWPARTPLGAVAARVDPRNPAGQRHSSAERGAW